MFTHYYLKTKVNYINSDIIKVQLFSFLNFNLHLIDFQPI